MDMGMGGEIKLFFHKFEYLQKSFIVSPMPMSTQESLKKNVKIQMLQNSETFRRDDSIIGHLVTSPSFARQSPLANDGDDTRWRMIDSSLLNVSGKYDIYFKK